MAANSSAAETLAFEETLGNLTSVGLSFGSGNYYSDGFGFSSNTGDTGSVVLTAFDTLPQPTPLPASAWSGLAMLGILGVVVGSKRLRTRVG